MMNLNLRFRPLDGESFSKLIGELGRSALISYGFRPLDGESFSKPASNTDVKLSKDMFPSPRRGIIF